MTYPFSQMHSRALQSLAEQNAPDLHNYRIVAVIPAYNEANQITDVLRSLPSFLQHVIVVDDASRDGTADIVRRCMIDDRRIVLLRHDKNQGVGGAMVSGFQKALELNAQIVVKLDGDGQMSAEDMSALIQPLLNGSADFAKGNRFRDFQALNRMPWLRRAGNMALSFLTKAAVGYWRTFDPCNGYIALRAEVLRSLPLVGLHRSFFFETSLLSQMYLMGAVVKDVPMPARYGNEISHLSITRVLFEFPPKLMACLLRRIVLKNFIYDFSMESLYLLSAMPLLLLGMGFGGWKWWVYATQGIGAPTGTVVLPAMFIMLGFQLLLSAISEDLRAVPETPLCAPLPAHDDLASVHEQESHLEMATA
jgi:dolichol-phosphate mannosyltransferase